MRSRAAARRLSAAWSVSTSSQARKNSSAMLSAASTAIFSVSPAGRFARGQPHLLVDVGRQLGDVVGRQTAPDRVPVPVNLDVDDAGFHRRVVRAVSRFMGSRLPEQTGSEPEREIQPLNLLQHLVDARADQVALLAQREDLAAGVLGVGEPRPRESSSRVSRAFSSPLGVLAARRSTMPTSSLTFSSSRSMGSRSTDRVAIADLATESPAKLASRRTGAARNLGIMNRFSAARRRAASARRRSSSIAVCTSSSVSVRSAARNVRRSERLTCLGWNALSLCSDRTRRSRPASAGGRTDSATNRAAGKVSGTRIETSRTIDGKRGSDSARRSSPAARSRTALEIDLGDVELFGAGEARGLRPSDGTAARRRRSRPVGVRRCQRFRRAAGNEERTLAPRRTPSATRRWRRARSTTPLVSKKSTPRAASTSAARQPRRPGDRGRARLTRRGGEPAAGLEQADVLPLAPAIVRAARRSARQQRRAQHRVLLGQRVGDRRRFGARLAEWQRGLALDEREGHRLGEAAGGEHC